MIYFDSSALLKLLFEESESAALERWVTDRAALPILSSELVKVEVIRAARRLDPSAVSAARSLVAQLDLIPLTTGLLDETADVGEPPLRSLDSIHLASALSVRSELSAFVAYDMRLISAAEAAGLPTIAPA
ncbi:MAG: type II toxin-antitoxin system VapC family toxin [Jatrophihabitantaceae bacterium]